MSRKVRVFGGHAGTVCCLDVEEGIMYTGSADRTARAWDADQVRQVRVFEGHTSWVRCMQVHGGVLYTGSADGTARAWDTMREKQVAWDVWDAERAKELHLFKGHAQYVRCLEVADNVVYTGSEDSTVAAWDASSGSLLQQYLGHAGTVSCLRAADGMLFSGSEDHTARAWAAWGGTTETVHEFAEHTGPVNCIEVSGSLLFTGSADCTARAWDTHTGQLLHVFGGHSAAVWCLHVADSMLYTGSKDATTRVWDSKNGRHLHVFLGHADWVRCLQVSDGVLYTGSKDATVRAWDASDGQLIRIFEGHTSTVWCLKVSEGVLYTGSGDETARAFCVLDGLLSDTKEHVRASGLRAALSAAQLAVARGTTPVAFDGAALHMLLLFLGRQAHATSQEARTASQILELVVPLTKLHVQHDSELQDTARISYLYNCLAACQDDRDEFCAIIGTVSLLQSHLHGELNLHGLQMRDDACAALCATFAPALGADELQRAPLFASVLSVNLTHCSLTNDYLDKLSLYIQALMPNMQLLDLSGNESIVYFPKQLCFLPHLRSLNLSATGIAALPLQLPSLVSLQVLRLALLPMTRLPLELLGRMTKLSELDVSGLALESNQQALVGMTNADLLVYLRQAALKAKPCRQTQIAFLGAEGAGKTALIRNLLRDKSQWPWRWQAACGGEEPTDGTAVSDTALHVVDESVVPPEDLSFSLLDFAGQPLFYEAHQPVLEALVRAVYVIVYSAANREHLAAVQYWLEFLGPRLVATQTIVVATHTDVPHFDIHEAKRDLQACLEQCGAEVGEEKRVFLSNSDVQTARRCTGELSQRLVVAARAVPGHIGSTVPVTYHELLRELNWMSRQHALLVQQPLKLQHIKDMLCNKVLQAGGVMPEEVIEPALRYWSQNGDIVWFGQTAGLLHDLVARRQWLLDVFGILFHLQPCHRSDASLPAPALLAGLLSHSDFGTLLPSEVGFNGKLRDQIVELFRACHLSFAYRLDLAAQRGSDSEAASTCPGAEHEHTWSALFQHALNSKAKARKPTRAAHGDDGTVRAASARAPRKPPGVSANKALNVIMRKAFSIEVFPSLLACDPYNGFLGPLPDVECAAFPYGMALRIDIDNCPAQKVQRVFWRTMSHISGVASSAPRAASSCIAVKTCRVCRDELVLELQHNQHRKCRLRLMHIMDATRRSKSPLAIGNSWLRLDVRAVDDTMLEPAADALLFTMEQTLSLLVATQRRTQRRRRGMGTWTRLAVADDGTAEPPVKMRVNKLEATLEPSPTASIAQRLPLLVLLPCTKTAERALLATSTAGIGAKPLAPSAYRLLVLCERSCGGCDYHFPAAHEGLLVEKPEQLVRQYGAELEHTASLLESVPIKVLTTTGYGASGPCSSLGPPQKLHPFVLKGLSWMMSRSDGFLSAMPVRRLRKVCHSRAAVLGETAAPAGRNTVDGIHKLLVGIGDEGAGAPSAARSVGVVQRHKVVTGGASWLCTRCSHTLLESGKLGAEASGRASRSRAERRPMAEHETAEDAASTAALADVRAPVPGGSGAARCADEEQATPDDAKGDEPLDALQEGGGGQSGAVPNAADSKVERQTQPTNASSPPRPATVEAAGAIVGEAAADAAAKSTQAKTAPPSQEGGGRQSGAAPNAADSKVERQTQPTNASSPPRPAEAAGAIVGEAAADAAAKSTQAATVVKDAPKQQQKKKKKKKRK
jgi:WD40 repeat protein